MPRRQLNNSVAVAKQHGIGPYENAIDTLLGEACEGRVDVALAARIQNPKFESKCKRGNLRIFRLRFKCRIVRIDQETDGRGAR